MHRIIPDDAPNQNQGTGDFFKISFTTPAAYCSGVIPSGVLIRLNYCYHSKIRRAHLAFGRDAPGTRRSWDNKPNLYTTLLRCLLPLIENNSLNLPSGRDLPWSFLRMLVCTSPLIMFTTRTLRGSVSRDGKVR